MRICTKVHYNEEVYRLLGAVTGPSFNGENRVWTHNGLVFTQSRMKGFDEGGNLLMEFDDYVTVVIIREPFIVRNWDKISAIGLGNRPTEEDVV